MLRSLLYILCCVCLLAPAGAEVLTALNPNGTTTRMDNLTVVALTTKGNGAKELQVSFGGGAPTPVEFSRIQNIDFAPGRPGELRVGADAASAQAYRGTLHSYANGMFVASPEGATARYQIPATNLLAFRADGAPAAGGDSGAPFGEAAPSAPASGGSTDFFASDSSGAADASATMADSGDSGDSGEELTEEEAAAIKEFESALGTSAAMGIGQIIFAVFVLILFFTTYFWLMINAFMHGKTGWGIAIIFSCCCIFIKPAFLSHYEGSGKNVVTVLVVVEIICAIAARVLDVVNF